MKRSNCVKPIFRVNAPVSIANGPGVRVTSYMAQKSLDINFGNISYILRVIDIIYGHPTGSSCSVISSVDSRKSIIDSQMQAVSYIKLYEGHNILCALKL